MTSELIERFRTQLETLEKERLKIIHDRKAYLFIVSLISFLAFCCVFAGALGPSHVVLGLALLLATCAAVLARVRAKLGGAFRKKFREGFTRDWFHAAHPGAFLAPAPPKEQIPIEVSRSLREACIRATAQNPSRTFIEERIFFDTDTYHSWAFVLAERSLFGSLGRFFGRDQIRSRAIVWFRAASDETPLVAFALPPQGFSHEPDVRFFMNGKPISATEPLKGKLVGVYDRLLRKAGNTRAVRVSVSPIGVWAGVRLKGALFEPPVLKSVLDVASYASWADEARLLADREISSWLATI